VVVALSLIGGCRIVADCWLSYSRRLLAVEVMGMAFAVVGMVFAVVGMAFVAMGMAVMVVQLWLSQLWNCGFHCHGIVTVAVVELWLLRLLNVAIAFIDLLPELQKATINWLSMDNVVV